MTEIQSIKFLRVLETNRTSHTLAAGKPLWVTDYEQIRIGDGSTAGAVLPAVYDFEAYDTTGAVGISGTAGYVALDTVRHGATSHFQLASGVGQVLVAGRYKLEALGSLYQVTATSMTAWEVFIEIDTTGVGSSYAEVACTRAAFFTRKTGTLMLGSMWTQAILDLPASTLVRIGMQRYGGSGTARTYASGSKLIMTRHGD